MNRPKMILFDAGKTLIDYLPKTEDNGTLCLSTIEATEKLMQHVVSNPNRYDAATIDRVNNEVFEKYNKCREAFYEINNQTILKMIFDLLNIELSISFAEVERIIWENSARIVPVEGTQELLDRLKKLHIRTAVISNLDFSGYLLVERLNQLLPNNEFEFVIASSDYGVRKPQRLLFEVGIAKSGLMAEEIWYVGDKVKVDAAGSQAAGMTPVLFKSKRNTYADIPKDIIVIENYTELVELLKKI